MGLSRRAPAGAGLPEVRAGGMVDDDEAAVGQCPDGMTAVCGYDRDNARPCDLRTPLDCHFHFSFNHFINLIFGMEMLMDRRAGCEIVMGGRHVYRVKIPALPAREAFDNSKFICVHKGHMERQTHSLLP